MEDFILDVDSTRTLQTRGLGAQAVRQLAEKRDIHIALSYSVGDRKQFYGDDDLSRVIVYQRVTSCDGVCFRHVGSL